MSYSYNLHTCGMMLWSQYVANKLSFKQQQNIFKKNFFLVISRQHRISKSTYFIWGPLKALFKFFGAHVQNHCYSIVYQVPRILDCLPHTFAAMNNILASLCSVICNCFPNGSLATYHLMETK